MRKDFLLRVLAGSVVLTASYAWAGDGIKVVTWLVEMVDGAGIIDTGQTSFVLSEDGRVATTIGCNRMAGKAEVEGDTISIGPLMSTKMACAEALMKQERLYGAALESARKWAVEDGMLKLKNAEGTVVVSFGKGG